MFSLQEINGFIQQTLANGKYPKTAPKLYEPVQYTLALGGKRIRPMLCLLSYNLFSNQIDDSILLPAAALEYFHNFTLIHDDVMDGSEVRRNQPTVYKKWSLNSAILSGDVMNIMAFKLLSRCPQTVLPQVLAEFCHLAQAVCEGQQLDLDYEKEWLVSQEDYIKMIALKTAVLIAGSAKIGAICGGADPQQAQLLYDFGYALGLAFQVQDDVLDTYGTPGVFGKPIGDDIACNKKSWLLVYALNHAQGAELQALRALMDKPLLARDDKVAGVMEIYERLGVKEAAEACIKEHWDRAMACIDKLELPDHGDLYIKEFALNILNRNK